MRRSRRSILTTVPEVTSSSATIQQMLVAFPQYNGITDTWGNVGNFAYNALQLMVQQRPAHGLTFTFNYTYSKNLGDDGTYRSGWALPGNALSRSTNGALLPQNRIDRSFTVISIPQTINIFGVYQLPFGGKGQPGGDNAAVRWLAGGWQLSEIYTYLAGTPIVVNGGSGSAGQGQAMPDMNPAWTSGTARQNGSYGSGPNGYQFANLSNIKYVNSNAFISAVNNSTAPGCVPGSSSQFQGSCQASYLIGNAPRTAAYGLRNPGTENLNLGLRRSFPLGRESRTFVFEANCFNVWNKVTFGGPSAGLVLQLQLLRRNHRRNRRWRRRQRRPRLAVRRPHQLLTMKTSVPPSFPQSTRKGWDGRIAVAFPAGSLHFSQALACLRRSVSAWFLKQISRSAALQIISLEFATIVCWRCMRHAVSRPGRHSSKAGIAPETVQILEKPLVSPYS